MELFEALKFRFDVTKKDGHTAVFSSARNVVDNRGHSSLVDSSSNSPLGCRAVGYAVRIAVLLISCL